MDKKVINIPLTSPRTPYIQIVFGEHMPISVSLTESEARALYEKLSVVFGGDGWTYLDKGMPPEGINVWAACDKGIYNFALYYQSGKWFTNECKEIAPPLKWKHKN